MSGSKSVFETIAALRRLGFFADRAGSDAAVADAVLADYRAMWGRAPAEGDPRLDLELLRFDPDRVWWEDSERDVAPSNEAYVEAIRDWAAISRGALRPTEIRETWDTPTGPIRIRLRHAGRRHVFVAAYLDDYLDLGVLDQLNRVIADGPYRLLVHAPFDQTAFVIAATVEERGQLEKRGWRFAESTAGTGPGRLPGAQRRR